MARLFFAIWPPPSAAAALHDWADARRRASGGRALAPASIHLTLAFLGDVPQARTAQAQVAAAQVRAAAFDLNLDEAAQRPRQGLIWIAPRELPAPLEALVAALALELRRADFALEHRAFLAHVTLLRRARKPCDLPAPPAITWRVREFALVRSHLEPEGAHYETLATFALAD